MKYNSNEVSSDLLESADDMVGENINVFMEVGLQSGILLVLDMIQNVNAEKYNDCSREIPREETIEMKQRSEVCKGECKIENTKKSFIEKFVSDRLDNGLEETSRNDKEYQVERQRFHKEAEKLRVEDFTPEQWKVIDDVLNEYNNHSAEYGRMAYKQCLKDIADFVKVIF